MSILGFGMILCYAIMITMGLIKNKARWYALNAAIIVALFSNVGTVVSTITYSDFAMYMLLITCFIEAIFGKKIYINKKCLGACIILFAVIGLGMLYLVSPVKKPEVLLMHTNMDLAYMGRGTVEEARFTVANKDAIIRFLVFCVVLIFCREFLSKEKHVTRLLDNVYKAYIVFFFFATIEFIVNNLISSTLIRDIFFKVIGDYDPAKTFYPRNRLGYYGFMGLYSEESYISMMLPFFGIVYVSGIKGIKEMLSFLWGSAVLLMSGCTTGLLLFLFPIIILGKLLIQRIPKSQRGAKRTRVKFMIIVCILVGLGVAISQREVLLEVASDAIAKMQTMMMGAKFVNTAEAMSADIRNFSNTIALNAFKASPLLGVGLGTTRGYGIITGFLATFGILGIIAYLYFFHALIGMKMKKKKMLVAILIGYMTSVLSVNFVYSLMMVPIFLLFSEQLYGDTSRRVYVKS